MWPRQEDQSRFKQPGYAGFVSYMSRKDAELAVKELDGSDWQGHALKVCISGFSIILLNNY